MRLVTKVAVLFVLAGAILAVVVALPRMGNGQGAPVISDPDLSDHPVYSNYVFGNAENTIEIGTQPLYLPTGLITETMKRDAILREALESLGMEVRFYPFLKGYDVNFFLSDGHLDAGVGGDMPAITAAATLDTTIVALTQRGFTSIVADRPMMVAELRGKSIGYAFGSNAHYALLSALASAGIAEEQVDLVPLDVTEMPEALDKGEIDAFSAWQPFPAIAAMMQQGNTVVHRSLSSGYLYFSSAFAESYPQAVRYIVAAEVRAIEWMQSERQNLLKASEWSIAESQNLSPLASELSVEQTANLAMQDILGLHSTILIPLSFLEENGPLYKEFQFLQGLGSFSSSASWDKVRESFDREITTEVLSNPRVYRLHEFKYDSERSNQP